MRDFTGRELVKLLEVKEGDTLEVRAGASQFLNGGTYTVERGNWGLLIKEKDGGHVHYLDYMPQEFDPSMPDEPYISGVYHPETPVTQEPAPMSTTLSEDEMRDFFARMVSTIVGYSKQAEELKGVQAQIAELAEKFSRQSEYVIQLEARNQNYSDQITAYQGKLSDRERTISDLTAERDLYVEQNANLHKEKLYLDDELEATRRDVDNFRDKYQGSQVVIEDKDHRISELQEQLRLVMEDRDATSALYSETRDKLSESERKLRGVEDAIRNVNESFSSLRAVS